MPVIHEKQARSILSKASGFADAFDYTLNPYSGCAFGCTYCYAAFFAPDAEQQETWGRWVTVKANALDLLRKRRKRPLIGKSVYISTVTDPYQPVERKLELTRAILLELAQYHDVRLMIQTRSPLVLRDLDVLRQFNRVRVNMTVTTDDERIRKLFEPACPPNPDRLDAIREVTAAGIPTSITMTPLLPVTNAVRFADMLLETGVQKFVVQHFHATKARFAAGTGDAARQIAGSLNWDQAAYQEVVDVLRARLPDLREGKPGFSPEW